MSLAGLLRRLDRPGDVDRNLQRLLALGDLGAVAEQGLAGGIDEREVNAIDEEVCVVRVDHVAKFGAESPYNRKVERAPQKAVAEALSSEAMRQSGALK